MKRKAALLIACVLFFLSVPCKSAFAAGATDEILNYTITVDVNSDATLYMQYHIDWEVLDIANGKALLLSKDCLDVWPHNERRTSTTWADCSLRSWLNDEFLNKAFTKTEQAAIRKELIENPDNPKYKTNGGENTKDKIFCLSIGEAERYLSSDEKRQKKACAYAMAKGAFTIKDCGDAVIWWLRSPGFRPDWASHVGPFGEVHEGGPYCINLAVCVCPALYVDLANLSS